MKPCFDDIYMCVNDHLQFPSPIGILGLAVTYTALVIVVRWQMIARPIRNGIDARILLLEADAHRLGEQHETGKAVIELMDRAANENKWQGPQEAIFWSRGKETAIWQMIDKAESYLVDTLETDELTVRLASTNARLRELTDPAAHVLSLRIGRRLDEIEKARGQANAGVPDKRELCELHRESIRLSRESLVAGDVDSDYFNNKILWHIMVALAALVIIANIGPALAAKAFQIPNLGWARADTVRSAFISLLLGGAVGGILSRLTRALRTDTSPAQRGLSWMAMFLSPLVGALAGWAGGMLLLAGYELNILIPGVKPEQLWLVLTSLAVLFGFSERLFTGIAEKLENNLVPAQKGTGPSVAPGPSTPPQQ